MPHHKPYKVLIVEDDAVVNQSIQTQVERLGLEVAGAAYNGEEAVALTRQCRPDVILMDMRMSDPGSGMEDPKAGFKASQAILEKCPTPIVLLTAYESPELVRQASEVGVSAYLVKPVMDND
jgi:CheY-like chemotaxis protein